MRTSTERILTTHVGSMPRPQYVVDQLFAQDRDEAYDQAEFDRVMQRAVLEVARKQVDAGVDVISDGEMSKISYVTYMRHRFTGLRNRRCARGLRHKISMIFPPTSSAWLMLAARRCTIGPLCATRSRSKIWDRWRRTSPIW